MFVCSLVFGVADGIALEEETHTNHINEGTQNKSAVNKKQTITLSKVFFFYVVSYQLFQDILIYFISSKFKVGSCSFNFNVVVVVNAVLLEKNSKEIS